MAPSAVLRDQSGSTAPVTQRLAKSPIAPEQRAGDRKISLRVWTAVAALLLTHAALVAYSATRHSPTLNEPGHLVAGLSHWTFGRFEVYRVNPPLVHYIAAVPVICAGYEEDWSAFDESPGARPEFSMGEAFIAANGKRSTWLFTIARWACIPLSLTGGLFCFLWSRELWNSNVAGLVSLVLWCFEPNILAHGELITSDCAATSFGLGAGYLFWRWLRQPSWGRALAAGLVLGIAELTKTTWIMLFGLWPILWIVWLTTARRNRDRPSTVNYQSSPPTTHPSPLTTLAQLTVVLLLGLYALNLGYGFDGTLTKIKDFTFISSALTGEEKSGTPGNRFIDSPLAELPVPVPKQYLLGIDMQKKDFEDYGQPSYLRGEWKDGGWWYYYLYGLAVKTPHGTQFLLALAVFFTLHRRWTSRPQLSAHVTYVDGSNPIARQRVSPTWRDLVILLTPALTVLVLVSSQLEFNHHVRYVLPVLGFTFVFIGSVGAPAGSRRTQALAGDEGWRETLVDEDSALKKHDLDGMMPSYSRAEPSFLCRPAGGLASRQA